MSFKRFDLEDVVVSAESVTAPLWTGDVTTLSSFFTSSTQVAATSADYYYNVYQTSSGDDSARVQFSLAYGDKNGSGSVYFNSNVPGKAPSSTVYGQYRNLVLGTEEEDFTFGEVSSDYFYVLNIDRARYKEKLLPGSINITLKNHTTSGSLVLTDNSRITTTTVFNDAGRVYELVSGSLGVISPGKKNAQGYTENQGSYGKVLPDVGIILLNGKALDAPLADGGLDLQTNRNANTSANNQSKVFDRLNTGVGSLRLQSEETISSNFVFVRARNSEFNYSTNPSLITGSGEIRHNVMINQPQSFITAVGLYNDNNDLLGVAKLSKPLLKDFTKEALIRIKLDY
jgi:hypothetical protein